MKIGDYKAGFITNTFTAFFIILIWNPNIFYLIYSLAADSTNSGGSSTGGGGFAETDFSSASCGSSIDAIGASGATNVSASSSAIAGVGAEHQLVRVRISYCREL